MTKRTLGACDAAVCVSPRDGALCGWGTCLKGDYGSGDQRSTPGAIPLTSARPIALSATASHVLVLDSEGAVWVWGSTPGTGLDLYVDRPTLLTSLAGTRILQVSAGDEYSLFLTDTGGVLVVGSNHSDQLGLGLDDAIGEEVLQPTAAGIREPARCGRVRGKLAVALRRGRRVRTWVDGTAAATATRITRRCQRWSLRRVRRSASSYGRSPLAVTRCGRLYSWGGITSASLGHGDDEEVKVPKLVASARGQSVRDVRCGGDHSVVLTEAGEVYTMGEGDDGQLGHGDEETKKVRTLVVELSPPMTKAQVNALEVAGLAGKRALQSELSASEPRRGRRTRR